MHSGTSRWGRRKNGKCVLGGCILQKGGGEQGQLFPPPRDESRQGIKKKRGKGRLVEEDKKEASDRRHCLLLRANQKEVLW